MSGVSTADRVVRSAAILAIVAATGAGCADRGSRAGYPDVVYHGANVVTVNESFDLAEAVAVRGGRIIAVGSDAEIRRLAGPSTRTVDLEGKTVVPGFYDSHAHLYREDDQHASAPAGIHDLRHLNEVDDLLAALREIAARTPSGEWIEGRISETGFPEERLPDRYQLDRATPNHPVALPRGPHTWTVNSLALRRAGITRDTPDPPGGKLERNANGEPNGILREGSAQRLVGRLLPIPAEPSDEAVIEDMHRQLRTLVGLGITSANVAGVRPGDGFRRVQVLYDSLAHTLPRLTLQLRVNPGFDAQSDPEEGVRRTLEEIRGLSFFSGYGNDRLKLGGIKMSVDGGFTGQAAWMLEPYPDGSTGATRIPEDVLYRVGKAAHDLGWQLGIHTIGDGGIQMATNVLERIIRSTPGRDHRHYLHHASVRPPPETLRKLRENDIIISSQPNFTYDLAPFYAEAMSGQRLATNNPQRTFLENGIRLAYGSDHRPYGPIVGIWAAVTREGRDGEIYGADEEAVNVRDALRAATLGSAYVTFDDDERGSIEVGKVADMVVLTDDILTIEPRRIREIGVEQTIIDGEVVYVAERPLTAKFDDGELWYAGGESSGGPGSSITHNH